MRLRIILLFKITSTAIRIHVLNISSIKRSNISLSTKVPYAALPHQVNTKFSYLEKFALFLSTGYSGIYNSGFQLGDVKQKEG